MGDRREWPEIPYAPWAETCRALQLYCQMVGKYRLARTPWVNHSWHATLYVNARGLTTGGIPDGGISIELAFDLIGHRLVGMNSDGARRELALEPGTVSDLHGRLRQMIGELGGTPEFHGSPNEVADAVAFERDDRVRPYDSDAVTRFHRALVQIDAVFRKFRTGFLGKVSPVHLFWGSFDLAVTRFSGREAPQHPGGIPNLPDSVTREAYSHEVSSAGFWPGEGLGEPAFYSYAYPTPAGFADAAVGPDEARFDASLGEFILPYDAVRRAGDPEAVLLRFLQSTYEAAATSGGWDREKLECAIGRPGVPRTA